MNFDNFFDFGEEHLDVEYSYLKPLKISMEFITFVQGVDESPGIFLCNHCFNKTLAPRVSGLHVEKCIENETCEAGECFNKADVFLIAEPISEIDLINRLEPA